MPYPKIRLKPKRDSVLRNGHPWLFSGAIASKESGIEPGDIVEAVSMDGQKLGLGFYHPATDIAFRLLTRDCDQTIDANFWRKRILSAKQIREMLIPPDTDAFRLINAEGDFLPGLIVDRYANTLVVSFQTAGIEKHRDTLLELLDELIHLDAIYERSETRARQREGMTGRQGWISGNHPEGTVPIRENGLVFEVDVVEGQKTGFFLDQRPNRQWVRMLSADKTVLNCFSYTGGFSVYAAAGGAKRVISVETSKNANALAAINLARNGYSDTDHPIIAADVFKFLRDEKASFDMIILDPPAFAKTKHEISRATHGYKEINRQAMMRLDHGGLLLTFSCSNHIDSELFRKIVIGAAQDAKKNVHLLQTLGPGPDHSTLLPHTEGSYLKGLLLSVEND
ncbi:MAG: class I SAM-dependent rRNA methyltransferase [Deltaproteobacteria bacterium]|nr:class I SAM-dependent rRNA methyltransferase [Deltaproteobacteria bacterium]